MRSGADISLVKAKHWVVGRACFLWALCLSSLFSAVGAAMDTIWCVLLAVGAAMDTIWCVLLALIGIVSLYGNKINILAG